MNEENMNEEKRKLTNFHLALINRYYYLQNTSCPALPSATYKRNSLKKVLHQILHLLRTSGTV